LLGEAATQVFLKENAIRFDVDGEAIEMIEAPYVDAAGRESHGLVFQRGAQLGRRHIPLGLIVDLDLVSVGIVEGKRGAVAEITFGPAEVVS